MAILTNTICRNRTCQSRVVLPDEEVIKRRVRISDKQKTCEFCGSNYCKGNLLFLRPPNLSKC